MNIGIDLDYTISEMPEFFSILTVALRKTDHKVYIVSFRDKAILESSIEEVRGYGISFDGIYHPEDSETLTQFKTRMAGELNLDVFIDDMPEAFVEMPPNVKRLWLCDPEIYNMRDIITACK